MVNPSRDTNGSSDLKVSLNVAIFTLGRLFHCTEGARFLCLFSNPQSEFLFSFFGGLGVHLVQIVVTLENIALSAFRFFYFDMMMENISGL